MPDTHPRQQIREWIVARLIGAETVGDVTTYATAAGDRVKSSRAAPWQAKKLPAIAVYSPGEETDRDTAASSPRQLRREVEIRIEGAVRVTDGDAEAAMDALALQIELALEADWTCGGKAADIILLNTECQTLMEGDAYFGAIRLTYAVPFWRTVPAQEPTLDDFKTARIRYNLDGTQATADEAVDQLNDLDT